MAAIGSMSGTVGESLDALDRRSCELLGPTALVVQALMGILAVLSLVYKRHREIQKRPWKIWLYDVSKQVVGQMVCHGLNVLISDLGSYHSAGNACSYYFLNILLDTTLGVAMIYLTLQCSTWLLAKKLSIKGLNTGQYGNPPSLTYWARQAAVYVFAITTMKILVVALFIVWPGVSSIGDWLLSWVAVGNGDSVQVVFVMGIFPVFMNIIQFWWIDSIVKASTTSTSTSAHPSSSRNSGSQDYTPLFNSPDDDDDISPADVEHGPRSSTSRTTSEGDFETLVGTEDNKTKLSASGSPSPTAFSRTQVAAVTHDGSPDNVGSIPLQGSTRSRYKYKQALSSLLHLPIAYSATAVDTHDTMHSSSRPTLLSMSDDVAEPDEPEKSGWTERGRNGKRIHIGAR